MQRAESRRGEGRARRGRRHARSSPARSVRSACASSRTVRRATKKRARSSASRWRGSARAASICSSSRRSPISRRSSRRFARRARSIPTMPIVAQMTIGADGRTPYGAAPEDVVRALDRVGRRRHRSQLLRRAADDSRVHREDGAAHAQEAERAAERRHAARRRRPQHVHGEPGVHGDVRAPSRAGGREDRRRLLRHDAGAHSRDGRRDSSARAATAGGSRARRTERSTAPTSARSATRTRRRPAGRRAGSVRRALALGARSSRASEFVTSVEIVPPRGVDATRMLTDVGRLKDAGVDAVNVPDGPRAQSRMGALLTSVLIEQQVGIETVIALRLPRPQPARHAERPAGRVGGRAAQPAHHHRRSAEDGTVSRRDRGLRRRLDRSHESRAAT